MSESELRNVKCETGPNFEKYYQTESDDYFMQIRPNNDSDEIPQPLGQGGWDELGLGKCLNFRLQRKLQIRNFWIKIEIK